MATELPVAVSPISRWIAALQRRQTTIIAVLAVVGIALYLWLRFGWDWPAARANPALFAVLLLGGLPLVIELLGKLIRFEFGSDLLAGMSIVTSVWLEEYLAGAIVVLMLSGGEALESYALRSASSVLAALAKRMPSKAHRRKEGKLEDISLDAIEVGEILVVFPHEICPVDGEVVEGHGLMDESYLTGEPFEITKTVGSAVISGAINGETALTIRAVRRAADSRYAKIMRVMRESEETRPNLRRLGDQLGAFYTPIALLIAGVAWLVSGDPLRFLAVLVVATPCPLLIAIPVAIIGSISLCARRAIIIKSPVVLEQVTQCRVAIFDKTGTLTYGEPALTEEILAADLQADEVLALVAGVERYSKHPLARAITAAAESRRLAITEASEVGELPGQGLRGKIGGRDIWVTSRKTMASRGEESLLPPHRGGLECVVLIDDRYAATLRFRDAPRADSHSFVRHLGPKHQFSQVMIISGDRVSEVEYLAEQVGIGEVHAEQTPEQKLALVRTATAGAKTLYVGDGINDAPAMMAATVGIAMGQNSDVTTEAAGVVILENTLTKIDEFFHIGQRMRRIALQSAVGGMALSITGMFLAAAGWLSPLQGAISQEVIDVLAVLNALRAAFPPKTLVDL